MVVLQGLQGSWEILSYKYQPPMSLRGDAALTVIEKVWGGAEAMDGQVNGLGFLFLYTLLQGSTRCKLISTGWGQGWGKGGGYGGGFGSTGGRKNASDGYRLGQLLLNLYKDSRVKTVPASVLNILSHNKQLTSRMPKFRDTRKVKNQPIFNGWIDEREPRSPLNDLFSKVSCLLSVCLCVMDDLLYGR